MEIGNQEEETKDWARNRWKEEEKLKIEKIKEKKRDYRDLLPFYRFPTYGVQILGSAIKNDICVICFCLKGLCSNY